MSLANEFDRALASTACFASGQQVVQAAAGATRATCELVALDALACAVDCLRVDNPALASSSVAQLRERAAKLAARITYLLEPISPIEIDSLGCVVQLRSSPPQKNEAGTSYYELLVGHSGAITLVRYHCPPGALRSRAAAHLTREVLLRLVGDFEAVA